MDLRYNNDVSIPVNDVLLKGELVIPFKAKAIVVFSHGSGSSRKSSRNLMVAKYLHEKNFGTLLFDLLTPEEDIHYHNRFDIDLLTNRLIAAITWLESQPAAKGAQVALFGASTGAASALKVASVLPQVAAVVCRGGRPDLVMNDLPAITAPVLLIVGSLDHDVLQLNEAAFAKLDCDKSLEIVGGATHLFEEHGMMEKVAALASGWFKKYLVPVSA